MAGLRHVTGAVPWAAGKSRGPRVVCLLGWGRHTAWGLECQESPLNITPREGVAAAPTVRGQGDHRANL